MQATTHRFATVEDAKRFAFAGNAIITLQSLRTNTHFTYKVRQATDKETGEAKPGMHFVSLLTNGSADEGDFNYLGMIMSGEFRLTRASKAGVDAPSVKAFRYFLGLNQLHPELVVRHENHCGRCGRTLTVPESIDRGIGPECATKM